jgi:hypothetical protein
VAQERIAHCRRHLSLVVRLRVAARHLGIRVTQRDLHRSLIDTFSHSLLAMAVPKIVKAKVLEPELLVGSLPVAPQPAFLEGSRDARFDRRIHATE